MPLQINSKTQLLCVIGKPSRHSRSPAMHNAGFSELGLNMVYLAFEPENLKKTVEALRQLGALGFNVTMPFKEEIIPLLDRMDDSARRIGAVNTVVNSNGRLTGYNTDGEGAVSALKTQIDLRGKKILMLGSGGAAKAICFALEKEGTKITVSSRNTLSARKLAKTIGHSSVALSEIKSLEEFDVLINATPVGMEPNARQTPIAPNLLHKKLVVFDLVYEPRDTVLLKEAKRRGCRTIEGLEMLLGQGFASFELFTGKKAPRDAMRRAIR
ncbi:MAG: shikimate dehydrogenase [archaeon]|nr:shikimate dehydrogenase [archaeon]